VAVFVPLADGVQVDIVHILDDWVISNRLWFVYDTPPWDTPALQGLSDGVASWWTTFILPYLSNELLTTLVRVSDWTTPTHPEVAATIVNTAGGVAAESSTANVAVVVGFRWGLGTRLKRNKHFVAGVPEQEITLNTPSATIRDILFEGYTALIDETREFYPDTTWRWVVASAFDGGAARTTQYWETCQGTYPRRLYPLGQRRKRLPV